MSEQKIFNRVEKKPTKVPKSNQEGPLNKWAEFSTIHAIPNIFRSKIIFVKAIWFLSLIISTGFCSYMVVKSIQNYLEFNVVTKITVVDENPIVFPTISICNINPIVNEAMFEQIKQISESFKYNYSDFEAIAGDKYKTKMDFILKSFTAQNLIKTQSDGLKKLYGYPYDKFIISCLFKTIICDRSDFVWYYDVVYGNCYRFNSGKHENGTKRKLRKLNKVGIRDGLMLDLFVGDGSGPFSLGSGARIFIHNHSFIPNPYEGFIVKTGTLTSVILSKTYSKKMPYPYSNCVSDLERVDSKLYKIITGRNNTYKKSDCLNLCYQYKLTNTCSCYDTTYEPISIKDRPCISINDIICLYKIIILFAMEESNNLCDDECPLECESLTYAYTISHAGYPSKAIANEMLKDPVLLSGLDNKSNIIDFNYLRENILAVSIYFDALQSTVIEESEQMNFVDLVSGIGGTLGLFLGVSVLTLVEIIELFCELIFRDKTKVVPNK